MKATNIFQILLIGSLSFTSYSKTNTEKLSINYVKTDISCFGKNDGSISLEISGGKRPYTIHWQHGSAELKLMNLSRGSYFVKVIDANKIERVEEILIDQPDPIRILFNSKSPTFIDGFNGYMNLSVFGGSPWQESGEDKFFYRLNSKPFNEMPETMSSGLYDFKIEDSRGCSANFPIELNIEVITSKNELFGSEKDEKKLDQTTGVTLYVIYHPLIQTTMVHRGFDPN